MLCSGIELPADPESIMIEAAVNQHGQSIPLAELDSITCQVVPRLSVEEKAALYSSGNDKVWPWFRVRDGTVYFKRSSSRWFLAGRAIASYECQ
jgi:hypothetical protein